MKNVNVARLSAWAWVLTMPLWMGSCGKDGEGNVSPNSIQATWRYTGLRIDPGVDFQRNGQLTTDLLAYYRSLPNGAGTAVVNCLTTSKITFAAGGAVLGMPGPTCDPASAAATVQDKSTWKLDGDMLTITSSIGPTVYTVSRTGDALRLAYKHQVDYDGNGTAEPYTTTLELVKE